MNEDFSKALYIERCGRNYANGYAVINNKYFTKDGINKLIDFMGSEQYAAEILGISVDDVRILKNEPEESAERERIYEEKYKQELKKGYEMAIARYGDLCAAKEKTVKANAERNEPQPICKGIEEYAQKRAKEKLEENLNEIIKSMILEGDISAEKIARWCHTTVEHVEEIRAKIK